MLKVNLSPTKIVPGLSSKLINHLDFQDDLKHMKRQSVNKDSHLPKEKKTTFIALNLLRSNQKK